MIMNSSDSYFNHKKINELMWYSCGPLGTSGCVTQSVMVVNVVNVYSGTTIGQGTWGVKLWVNKEAGNKEAASIYTDLVCLFLQITETFMVYWDKAQKPGDLNLRAEWITYSHVLLGNFLPLLASVSLAVKQELTNIDICKASPKNKERRVESSTSQSISFLPRKFNLRSKLMNLETFCMYLLLLSLENRYSRHGVYFQ